MFAGGWTREAAEEVCSGEGIEQDDVLDILSALVDKSLVVAEAWPISVEGELRYRMLEPIRQYCQERLAESGEADATRDRHAASFLALAEKAGPELRGPRQVLCGLRGLTQSRTTCGQRCRGCSGRESRRRPRGSGGRFGYVGAAEAICVACYTGALVAQAEHDDERARGSFRRGWYMRRRPGTRPMSPTAWRGWRP